MLAVPPLQQATDLGLRACFSGFTHGACFRVACRLCNYLAIESVMISIAHLVVLEGRLLLPRGGGDSNLECGTQGRRGERTDRVREVHWIEVERLTILERLVPVRRECSHLVLRLNGHRSLLLVMNTNCRGRTESRSSQVRR